MRDKAKYFFLNENCILIKGGVNGAVYDLETGAVYSIKRKAVSILDHCEKYRTINQISTILKIPHSDLYNLFEDLKSNNLGNFYLKPVYIDNPMEFYQKNVMPSPIKLKTLAIELHRMCNLNCSFCMGNSLPDNKYIYCGCSKEKNSPTLSFNNIRKVIFEARKFGLESVYIIGGNPFLLKEEMRKLLRLFDKNSINVTVHSHATDLDDYCIELLSELKIKLSIPVYSHREKTHDEIVGVKNNYRTLLAVLEKLLKGGIRFDLTAYISEYNVSEHTATYDFFYKLGCRHITHKFIYPVYQSDASGKFLDVYNEMNMTFPKMNCNLFLLNKNYNYCLNQKIAITSEGNIIPCHLSKTEVIGNVNKENLSDLLRQGNMEPYWKLSKEKFEICKHCEFRYACVDCPIIGNDTNDKMFYKNSFCKYNPISGEMEMEE